LGLPLSYDDLAARVGAAASWASGVRRHLGGGSDELAGPGGTVVAVTGAKGGVGTTLAAVQLALAAQSSGRGSALVDMDLQSGDVASYLDVQFRRSAADLAGISDISARVLQDAVYTHESGLGLLLAPGEGERAEEVDDRAARQIIGALRARYDIVLVDCGTQLNAANAAVIETADLAVLLTTPDVVAVRAAKRMVRMWDRLQIRKADEAVTLVNRTSKLSEIQPALIARIVGTPVARSTIPANFKELQSAVDAGRMQDLDDKGSVKQALWGFAGELGLVTAAEAPPGSKPGNKPGNKPGSKQGGKGARGGKGPARAQHRQVPGPRALPAGSGAANDPGAQGTSARAAAPGPVPGAGTQGGPGAGGVGSRQALPPAASSRTLGTSPNASMPGARYGPEQGGAGTAVPPRGRTQGASAAPGVGQRSGHVPPGPPAAAGPVGPPAGPQGAHAAGAFPEPLGSPGPQRPRIPQEDDDDDGDTSVWGDKGGLTVEFAGMAPIVLVVLAILWQCVLIGYTFSLAGNAADEAARAATAAASDGDAQGACEAAATEHLPAEWRKKSKVNCSLSDDLWKADVDLSTPVLFPGAGKLPFTVSGRAGAAEEG
ncbi:MAG TPA: AAA family ATPase, partial [Streptomyces sp.]|nr:AAA family ATPase [Streptomyces sp.]